MDNLTCFIIDDEPLALGLIESYVLKTPFLTLTGAFSSAISALDSVRNHPPDLLFLDIQMAELNGMDFARMIPAGTGVIFTTAFQQYALESYRVNAIDYLLKPFSYAEFLTAADKALNRLSPRTSPSGMTSDDVRSIFVKADYKLLQVDLDQILYVEGLKDYVRIHTDERTQPITTHLTMKAMEEQLPSGRFLRVHRSYIVQLSKVRVIERNRIVFGKTYIPVSDLYKEALESAIGRKLG